MAIRKEISTNTQGSIDIIDVKRVKKALENIGVYKNEYWTFNNTYLLSSSYCTSMDKNIFSCDVDMKEAFVVDGKPILQNQLEILGDSLEKHVISTLEPIMEARGDIMNAVKTKTINKLDEIIENIHNDISKWLDKYSYYKAEEMENEADYAWKMIEKHKSDLKKIEKEREEVRTIAWVF